MQENLEYTFLKFGVRFFESLPMITQNEQQKTFSIAVYRITSLLTWPIQPIEAEMVVPLSW